MKHSIAQRRGLFNRLIDFGKSFTDKDVFSKEPKALRPEYQDFKNQLQVLDDNIRSIALYHGANSQSLFQDLKFARRELHDNNLLECNRYLNNFNQALYDIYKLIVNFLDNTPIPSKFAGSFEDLYSSMLIKNKEGLVRILEEATDTYQVNIKPIFESLDKSRSHRDYAKYILNIKEMKDVAKHFNDKYERAYKEHVSPILQLKSKQLQAPKDVITNIRQMSEKLMDKKFEPCQCNSGWAYAACHGLDEAKIRRDALKFMNYENPPINIGMCHCGSGKLYQECHGETEKCKCGSGKSYANCHAKRKSPYDKALEQHLRLLNLKSK